MTQKSVIQDNQQKDDHKQGLQSGNAVARKRVIWRAWPEIGIVLLLLFTVVVVVLPGSNAPSNLSTASSAVFALPTSKIQSNLTGIQNGSSIVILLVVDKQAYRYPNTVLLDQRGDTVSISLKRDSNDTVVTDFAARLASATAIYILPTLTG